MRKAKRNESDRKIGLVIDWTETPYHSSLVSGVIDESKTRNCSLFVFEGGAIKSPLKRETPRNIIYNFIDSNKLDGLIVSAGSLTHYISPSEFRRFLAAYSPLPIITTSISVPGYESVTADSRSGLRNLLLHLVKDHAYGSIAFIKGPVDNREAQIRFDVYRKVLKDAGIPFNEELVVQGDFIVESGRRGARELVENRKVRFDALVASNDDMAIGAMEYLVEHGISVPEEVAVTGFDNLEIAVCSTPALTTVHQPVADIGKKALDLLLQKIDGDTVPRFFVLPSRCVIRESCGCADGFAGIANVGKTSTGKKSVKNARRKAGYPGFRASVKKECNRESGVGLDAATIERLCRGYYDCVSKNDASLFIGELEMLLKKDGNRAGNTESIDKLLTVMKASIDSYLQSASELFTANRVWYEAEKRVHELKKRELQYRSIIEGQVVQNLMTYRGDLTSATNLDEFVEILATQLEDIGIFSCYLSLYEDETPDSPTSLSRFIFGYGEGRRIRVERGGRLFPSRNLVPDGMLREGKRYTCYVEPLFFGNTQLGFVLLEFSDIKRKLQDLVRKLFVHLAFNGAVYVHQIAIQTLNFEAQVLSRTEAITRANELLTKLYNDRKAAENAVRKLNEELEKRVEERTKEIGSANRALKKTLNKLKSTQNQLVQSEKMAALGSLVAGISHEINTPIGISVTAASYMEKKTNDIYNLYTENKIKRTDLEKYFLLVLQASGMVLANLKKSYEMIHEFKNIAVDQQQEVKKTFDVRQHMEEIAHAMKTELSSKGHSLVFKCEERIAFSSYPGVLNRVLMLLLSNSLIHGFAEGTSGTITLRVRKSGRKLSIHYSDNGIGIVKANTRKVFAPFFTTKRSDGKLGLGLHIVFNLVTRTLGGKIRCASEYGKGTAFLIDIPDCE